MNTAKQIRIAIALVAFFVIAGFGLWLIGREVDLITPIAYLAGLLFGGVMGFFFGGLTAVSVVKESAAEQRRLSWRSRLETGRGEQP